MNFQDTIVFIIADLAALIVQAVGGGMAASSETEADAERGARVMVAGIIVQMGKSYPSHFLVCL